MNRNGTHLVLMLLVDALRADYVERMGYLGRLAAQGATGRLRECFGFVPRAAYFGGLDAEQFGFTNMYCWDPGRSPFGAARYLPHDAGGQEPRLRKHIEASARERLSPFARAYANSVEIPIEFLACFDLVEKRAPWERDAGYRSLFALMQERGIAWYQCSWPLTNLQADPSDAGIVTQTLNDLRPEHRFAYVHLQELDGAGHAHGPGSAELNRRLAAIDGLCERLIETLRQRFETLDVVLFGDHGMVTVTGTVDVWSVLESTGLRFEIDYGYFLDSTMARFWFFHAGAKARVEQALSGLAGGRLLREEDLAAYGIAHCDRRNSEMIFLADPGVLIFPNFFQRRGAPIKGMHGYDPDCPDNQGFFLLYSTREAAWAGQRTGPVDPPALFGLSCRLLGLNGAGSRAFPDSTAAEPARGRCTAHPDPRAEQMVEEHLGRIVAAVRERCGEPQAIVLTGSFGRGEGGVFVDENGACRPVNDYDLLVVSEDNCAGALQELGGRLAVELGLDFVDLGWTDGHWENLPVSVQHYDLKYGSRVIAGDPDVLSRIPRYAAADIPIYEAVKLLLNRSAGLLSGLRGKFLTGASPDAEGRRYLTNQVAKALMALGDWHLIRWGEYDSSYRRRAERLKWLGPGAGLKRELLARILAAYEFKVRPDYARFSAGLAEIAGFYGDFEAALIQAINLQTGATAKDLSQAMDHYLERMSAPRDQTLRENTACKHHVAIRRLLQSQPRTRSSGHEDPAGVSIRHLVYSVLPFLVSAAVDGGRRQAACLEAVRRLRPVLAAPPVGQAGPEDWERLRAVIVEAWFAICH